MDEFKENVYHKNFTQNINTDSAECSTEILFTIPNEFIPKKSTQTQETMF